MEVKKKNIMFLYLFSTIAVLKHMSLKENKVQFRKKLSASHDLPKKWHLSSAWQIKNGTSFVHLFSRGQNRGVWVFDHNIQGTLLLSIGLKKYWKWETSGLQSWLHVDMWTKLTHQDLLEGSYMKYFSVFVAAWMNCHW